VRRLLDLGRLVGHAGPAVLGPEHGAVEEVVGEEVEVVDGLGLGEQVGGRVGPLVEEVVGGGGRGGAGGEAAGAGGSGGQAVGGDGDGRGRGRVVVGLAGSDRLLLLLLQLGARAGDLRGAAGLDGAL